ncbi:MAG TPA: transposase [Blastocatellia bacterium]|nr:transposase [Blastocatellia bacterium]
MADITALYLEAKTLREAGERVVSTDEMTGIQALERKHPTIAMGPGRVERREFEYQRHGTVTLIANFDVAQGKVVAPSMGATRNEADFVAHMKQTVACEPQATRWHVVTDNLGIHTNRDKLPSIAYSEELISSTISATLQSTDRHHGIVGQERCHFQLDS